MKSSTLTTTSAVVLGLSGAALLFAPDLILPRFIPGFPVTGSWLGQLLGASWLGVAALNWNSRRMVLGGIYGRPIVLANLSVYFIGGMSALGAARRSSFPPEMLWIIIPAGILGLAYTHLMISGPWQGDRGRFGSA